MTKAACRHEWDMANIRSGYLVIEGCFHCQKKVSFFSAEPVPPIDDYREGDHYWSHRGDYQASQFDLKCKKCSKEIQLSEVMATVLCMRCNPECGIFKVGSQDPSRKTWVYVALCADTSHASGKCVTKDGIQALNEYFNRDRDLDKKIVVAPCRLRASADTCQGIVLVDVGLTELY